MENNPGAEYLLLFMIDKVEEENLHIEYCPMDQMWGYFMKKTTQGKMFRNFMNYILGLKE